MNRTLTTAVTALLCAVVFLTTFTACQNVSQIGVPADPTVTTTTIDRNATTTVAPTVPTTTTAVQVMVPSSDEPHSAGIDYFVPSSAAVPPSFFDDAVIVGDSITLKLSYYNIAHNTFSNAAFLTAGSLGVANALWDLNRSDAVHPSYQGQTVRVPEGIAATGCSKAYIMLGTNDLGLYGVEDTIKNFETLTDQIRAAAPGVKLYVQSLTPIYKERGDLTNDAINRYNALLSEFCREKGFYYVDVAYALRGDNGFLPLEYCSDPDSMGIHFTDTACQIWADYLYTHTGV